MGKQTNKYTENKFDRTERILSEILAVIRGISKSNFSWMTPEKLSDYIGLSIPTIYKYVSKSQIPYYKIPKSSKLLFKREEIDEWIQGSKSERSLDYRIKSKVDQILN